MRNERGRSRGVLKGILREPLAVILVVALLAPGIAAKERRGARIIITKTNGMVVAGELLAVKGTDLIIMDSSTSAEVTESLMNISSVDRIEKHSNWLPGMIVGAIAGAGVGALSGKPAGSTDPNDDRMTKGQQAAAGAVGFGLIGAYIGGTIKPKAIKVEKTDPEYLTGIAAKLKSLARDRS